MSALKFVSVLIAVLFFVSRLFTTITFAQVSQDQAASALANADSAVTLSYQAVLKAE
jgi:amino acid permease